MTDLSASRSRLDDIDARADVLLGTNSVPPAKIRARQKTIQQRWDAINKLRQVSHCSSWFQSGTAAHGSGSLHYSSLIGSW